MNEIKTAISALARILDSDVLTSDEAHDVSQVIGLLDEVEEELADGTRSMVTLVTTN